MIEIGRVYKPSSMSFEDKSNRVKVTAVRVGRVEYINPKTKECNSLEIGDFGWYYEPARRKKVAK